MISRLNKGQFLIASVPVVLGILAFLGCGPVESPPASTTTPPPQVGPYSQATTMPYVVGSTFIVSITNPSYTASTVAKYAELTPSGSSNTFYWYPKTSAGTWQTVNGTTLTTVFDTTVYSVPPGNGGQPVPGTVIGTGTILCIKTNLTGDSCPTTNPIKITPVTLTPCPCPCP